MKHCNKCDTTKPVTEFNKNSRKPDGLQAWCRDCCKRSNNDSYRVSEKRRDTIRTRNKTELALVRGIVNFYKSQGCLLCEENCSDCMDFHHVNADKDANISEILQYGKRKVLAEISKCVILCSNCHRKVHAGIIKL